MGQRPEVSISRGTLGDAGRLAALGAQTFADTFAADNSPEDMTAYVASNFNPEQQTAELSDPASIFFIAEVAGDAVGYAKLHGGKPAAGVTGESPIELVRLYVSRDWFGRDVGAALMRACLDEAQQSGHTTVWLGVWERNERAQAFYRKWGFRAVGEHSFQLGSDTQRDIVMELSL